MPLSHSRGYLPHIEGAEFQMITYRLADALPKEVVQGLSEGCSGETRRKKIESYLDSGYGKCWLAIPEIAELVIDNWFYFDGKRYDMIAYVVMPNHVHVLIRVYSKVSLSKIVHGWKSYTAKRIAAFVKEAGEPPALPVWQAEYWDRYIRNQHHFDRAIEYIHQNPVNAGLAQTAEAWPWSSFGKECLNDKGLI